jgi:hypothetical protein
MLGTVCNYSDAERALIGAIDPMWLSTIDKTNIYPSSLYRTLCTKVFINNETGPAVEALRRVLTAVEYSDPYRMTPEFDKLCEF